MKQVASSKITAIAFALLMLVPLVPLSAATHTGDLVQDIPVLPHARPTDQCVETTVPPDILAEANQLLAGNVSFFTSDKGVPALCANGAPISEYQSLIRDADMQLEILRAYTRQIQAQVDARLETVLPDSEYPDQLVVPRAVVLQDNFDGRRIGGFGEWTVVTERGEASGWHPDTDVTVNGTRHTYRFGTDEGYLRGAHQFLVSPEIDLTITPVDARASQDILYLRDRAAGALDYLICSALESIWVPDPTWGMQGTPMGGSGITGSPWIRPSEFTDNFVGDLCGSVGIPIQLGNVGSMAGLPEEILVLHTLRAAYRDAFDQTVYSLPVMQHTAELQLTYRANLAQQVDGVRVWAYVGDEPPTRVDLFQRDFKQALGTGSECPVEDQQGIGVALEQSTCGNQPGGVFTPVPAGYLLTEPTPNNATLLYIDGTNTTAAFGDEPLWGHRYAVTGDTGDFRTVTINMSRFMGNRVWLLFEAKTTPNDRGADIFRDPASFKRQTDYGFEITRVRAESDTFLRNFRLKDVGTNLFLTSVPNAYNDPKGVRVDVPPGNADGVIARVHNAGDYLENGTLTVTFDGASPAVIPVREIRPDEVREIAIPWPAALAEGRRYNVQATLTVENGIGVSARPTAANATSGLPETLPPATDPDRTAARPSNVGNVPGLGEYGSLNAAQLVRAYTSRNLTAVRADGTEGIPLQVCKSVTGTECFGAPGSTRELAAVKKGEQIVILAAVRNDGNAPQDAAADLLLSLDGSARPNAILDGARRELPDLLPGETRVLTWSLSVADPGVYDLSLAMVRGDGKSESLVTRHLYVQRSTGLICLDDLDDLRECGIAFTGDFEPALLGRNVTAAAFAADGALYVATLLDDNGGALLRRAPDTGAWKEIAALRGADLNATFGPPMPQLEVGWGVIRAVAPHPDGNVTLVGDNGTALRVGPAGELARLTLNDSRVDEGVALDLTHLTDAIVVDGETVVVGSNGTLALVSGEKLERVGLQRWGFNGTEGAKERYPLVAYTGTLHDVAIGPAGNLYAVGESGFVARHDGRTELLDAARWRETFTQVNATDIFPTSWTLDNRTARAIAVQDGRTFVVGDGLLAVNASGRATTFRNVTQPAAVGGFRADLAVGAHNGQLYVFGADGFAAACERCYSGVPQWSYPAISFPVVIDLDNADVHDADVAVALANADGTLLLGERGAILSLQKRTLYGNEGDWTTVPSLLARDGGVLQVGRQSDGASTSSTSFVGISSVGATTGGTFRLFMNHSIRRLDAGSLAQVSVITQDVREIQTNTPALSVCDPVSDGFTLTRQCPRLPLGRFVNSSGEDGWQLFFREFTLNATDRFVGIDLNTTERVRWAIDDVRVQKFDGTRWVDVISWYGRTKWGGAVEPVGDWYEANLPGTLKRADERLGNAARSAESTFPTTNWEEWHTTFDLDAPSAWHVSPTIAERPVWALNNERYYADGFASPSAPRLLNNWDTRLVTPIIDLTDAPDPVVSFRHLYAFRTQFVAASDTLPETYLAGDAGWLEVQYQLRGEECGPGRLPHETCWSRFYPVKPDAGYTTAAKLGIADMTKANQNAGIGIPDQVRTMDGRGFWGRIALPSSTNVIEDARDLSRYRAESVTLNDKICKATETPATKDPTNGVDCVPLEGDSFQGRKIRFAFHAQTAGSLRRDEIDPSGHDSAENVWNYTKAIAIQRGGPRSYPFEGWYVADFKLLGERPLGIDLAATNLTPRVGYDWSAIGLGPGTRVPINVTVENRGFFDALGYTGRLEIREVLDAGAKSTRLAGTVPLSQQPVLEVGASRNHTLYWTVPETSHDGKPEARYVVTFTATPVGIDRDEDVTDNVARLGSLSSPLKAKTERQFHLDLVVTPENASIELPRYVSIFLNNTGNVPLRGFTVERRIEALGRLSDFTPATCDEWTRTVQEGRLSSLVDCRVWTTARDIPAGTSVGLGSVSDDFKPTDLAWKAPERANFMFHVSAISEDAGATLTDTILRPVRAFATYLFDDAEGGVRGEAFQGAWTLDPAWSIGDEGYLRSPASYAFGDLLLDRYPDGADTSARMPTVDLGSARTARLAFYQNYRLEPGFDAGIVEASVDGGRTWTPLAPMRDDLNGLPLGFNTTHPLSAASPLHTTGDPERAEYAVTGDSSLLPGASEGWVLQQYDLTRYQNVSRDGVHYELYDSAALSGYNRQPVAPDPRASLPNNALRNVHFDKTWLVGEESEARYWEVQDLTNHTIRSPTQPGGSFWWSGSPSLRDDGVAPTESSLLSIKVDLSNVGADQRVIADWWEWADRFEQSSVMAIPLTGNRGSVPMTKVLTAHTYHPGVGADNYRFNLSEPVLVERQGKWFHLQADLTDVIAAAGKPTTFTVAFAHTPFDIIPGASPTWTLLPNYLDSRGLAIDEFRVRAVTIAGGLEVGEPRILLNEATAWESSTISSCTANELDWKNLDNKVPCLAGASGAQEWSLRAPSRTAAGQNWAPVTELPGLGAAWHVVKVRDGEGHSAANPLVDGETPRAWYTGSLGPCAESSCPDQNRCNVTIVDDRRCPVPGSESRLVTPAFDLARVAGEDARLSFDHRFQFLNYRVGNGPDAPFGSGGVVEVQEFDPLTQTWSGWKQLYSKDAMVLAGLSGAEILTAVRGDAYGGYSSYTSNETRTASKTRMFYPPFESVKVPGRDEAVQFLFTGNSSKLSPDTGGWLHEEYDVSEYIGKRVRFGFHVAYSQAPSQNKEAAIAQIGSNVDGDGVNKNGWWISNVGIVGRVLVGEPVQMRFRAATDGNVHDGFWLVDDVGAFGSRYRSNLGVFVDGRFGGVEGQTVTMPVVVRNLGESVRRDLAVEIRQAKTVELNFTAPSSFTVSRDPGVFRIEGLTLTPGESKVINVSVRVPAQVGTSTQTEILVQLRERTNSAVEPWGAVQDNEVQGMLQDVVKFGLARVASVDFTALRTTPAAPRVGEPVDVVATIYNTGYNAVTLDLRCAAHTVGGYARTNHVSGALDAVQVAQTYDCARVGGALAIEPDGWTNVTFRATPTVEGFLEFRLDGAIVGGRNLTTERAGTMVGRSAVVFKDEFDNRQDTRRNWTLTVSMDQTSMNAAGWSYDRGHNRTGSILLGLNESTVLYTNNQDYSASCLATGCVALSPPIDLHNATPGTPTFLTFWHLDRFATGDGGQVRAQVLLNENNPTSPTAWGPDCVLQPSAATPYEGGVIEWIGPTQPGQGNNPPPRDSNAAFTKPEYTQTAQKDNRRVTKAEFYTNPPGRWEDTWQLAVFNLDQTCFSTLDNVSRPLLGGTIRLSFFAAVGSPARPDVGSARGLGNGWYIDDVAISPYALQVKPAAALPQRATLLDNTTKTFHVVLKNLGGATDLVTLRLDAGNSSAPEGSVQVPAEAVEIAPGASVVVPVQITLPRDPTLLPTQFKVRLLAASAFDPNAFGATTLDVSFAPRRWAELGVTLEAPKVAAQEGIETFLPIVIQNSGPVESATSRLVVVDEWDGGREVTSLDLASIPSVFDAPEDATRIVEFRWRPAEGSRGEHTLTVTVDPDEIAEEYTRLNNVAQIKAQVTELVIPDLDVTSERALTLRNSLGGVISAARDADVTRFEATAGELVTFELKVANPGRAAATNVDVRAFIGSLSLPPKTIPYIAPGGEVAVPFNWLAQKGEHKIEFLVRSELVELTTANNRNPGTGVTLLTVKGYEIAIEIPSIPGVLEPGTDLRVNFTVTNAGNAGEDLLLRASAPSGMRVALPREGFYLRAGETYEGVAQLSLDDDAVAGEQFITIEAVARENPMKVATGRGSLQVKASYGGSVDGGLVVAAPPTFELPIELVNEGNSLEPWTVIVSLPPGWTAKETLPAKVVVPAHDRAALVLHVSVPETTAPGDRVIPVKATLPNGEKREGLVRVNVLPFHQAALTVQAAAPKPVLGKLSVPVVVENRGNVQAPFEVVVVSGPAGVELKVEPARFELPPGGKAVAQIIASPNASVEAGTYALTSYARFDGVRPDTREGLGNLQTLKLPIVRQDLRVASIEFSPRADLTPGKLVIVKGAVVNRGLAALEDVPVHLYVDDVFVAEQRIGTIEPGARTDVTFNWTAIGGEHTLTVVVDPYRDAVEASRDDNAVSALATVSGGTTPGGLAAQRGTPGFETVGVLAALAIALLAIPALGSRRQRR